MSKQNNNSIVLLVSYLCLLILSATSTVSANTEKPLVRHAHAVGFGAQYSGLAGYQINSIYNRHKVYFSIGFIGFGGGYDYAISNNVSIGASFTRILELANIATLNVNYHFGSAFGSGVVIGLDLGVNRSQSIFSGESNFSRYSFISVGYRF